VHNSEEFKSTKAVAEKLGIANFTVRKCLKFNKIPTRAESNRLIRYCSRCKTEKHIDNFHKNKATKNGYDYRCKECRKIDSSKRYRKIRDSKIRKKFGINSEIYERMLNSQNGRCAICGNEETSINKKYNRIKILAIDHDHKNNRVRGLLCSRCNISLGGFKEDSAILERAIEYLKKWESI